ncbi:MAG: nitroreductase family protein [Fulvivirga sp.]|nr:nitroreductase family protein [Fulvivirga sp.]
MDFRKLVEQAIKSSSGHNTQPWQFKIHENEIQVYPDLSRSLTVVDADNHALYISLGCAVENIVISARHFGLNPVVDLSEHTDGEAFISITFSKNNRPGDDELFHYIDERQSTRNEYEDKKVPDDDFLELENSFSQKGISTMRFTDSQNIKKLEQFIIEGSNKQFMKKSFVNELIEWIRFSKREAEQTGDGIWASSMGMPNSGRFIGEIVMKYFVSAKSEAKRWKKLIDASAGFFLFLADKNDIPHWIRLGRAFQRFGLTATKLGINHAHVNMPCEEMEVRERMASEFGFPNKHPLLLIRFGYSEKMPYSYRRRADEVITN